MMAAVDLMIGMEIYLPPVRRHWSRLLGRPIMSPIALSADGYDDMGPAYIDELHNKNCVMSYESYFGPGRMHVAWLPNLERSQVWQVRLLDPNAGDVEFAKRWMLIYNHPWPMTIVGVHPALVDAHKQWVDFQTEWQKHGWECEARRITRESYVAMDL